MLAACSSPSKPNPQPDPKSSFDLQPATDKLPILQGGEAGLSVQRLNGFSGAIIPPVGGAKDDQARALALQPDERVPTVRILMGGAVNSSNHDFALTCYWS